MRTRLALLSVVLLFASIAPAQSWQDCKANGGYSFSDVKGAVHRVTTSHIYLSWDDKIFSRAGDMTAVAILQTLTDADLADPKLRTDVLEMIRAAFGCPQRCVAVESDRQPRVTLLLLDHLRKGASRKFRSDIDATQQFVAQQVSRTD